MLEIARQRAAELDRKEDLPWWTGALLEHVRIDRPAIGVLMDMISPLLRRLEGASINRRTVENVRAAGLEIERVENLDGMGMFKLIVARASA